MKTKLNFHYSISFKETNSFEFDKKNDIVNEACYFHRVMPKLPKIIYNLSYNPNSRQEVIVTNDMSNNACLISLQFIVNKKTLIVLANFRSQDKNLGKPHDITMLRYFATYVMKGLKLNRFKILVNVGAYHERTDKNPSGY